MAFTAVQLTSLFTTANQGAAPTPAQAAQINAIAALNLTDAEAQARLGGLLQSTVGVAALTYAYFGASLPTAAGLDYLVSSDTNTADLNDAYYVQFNQENRFLNFALNLTRGAGAPYNATFAATFGALSYTETISLAYEQIISSTAAVTAGTNPTAAKAFFLNSLPFYQQVVTERGGLAATDPAFNLAVKAAIVGSIINEGLKAGVGLYADAYSRMIVALESGNTTGLGAGLLASYPGSVGIFTANAVGFNTANAAQSLENITTSDAANDVINTTIARLAGANANGRGAPDFDVLNITDTITSAVTLNDGAAGGTIGNVERLVLKGGSTATVTGPTLAATGIAAISFEQSTFYQTAAGSTGQTITGSPFNDVIGVSGGSNTINAGAGADTVNVSGVLANLILDGGDGVADVLNLAAGAGLTGTSTVAGFETVAIAGTSISLSVAVNEYLRAPPAGVTVTGLAGTADTVTLSGSGTARGLAAAEFYVLQSDMTFNIGAANQNVAAGAGVQVIRDDGFATMTGIYTTTGDGDQVTLDRGTAITTLSGGSFQGTFAALNILGGGTVVLDDGQAGIFTAINGVAATKGTPALGGTLQLMPNSGGAVTLGTLTDISFIDLSRLAPSATVSLTSNSTTRILLDDSSLVVKSGSETAAITVEATGANASITLGAAADTVSVGPVAGAVNIATGGGNDRVSFDGRANLGASDVLNGGAGTDTLEFFAPALSANAADFDSVTGFEVILDPNGLITAKDSLVATATSLAYTVSAPEAVANINFNAETNGQVNVTLGLGGGVVKGTSNLLSDSFTAIANHAKVTFALANGGAAFAGNTVAQIENVDKIAGFNVGLDAIDLPMAIGAIKGPGASVDPTSATSFIATANSYLTTAALTLAAGDVVLFENGGGVVYMVQNLSGTNVDAGDFVVQLTGVVGGVASLGAANFI